MASQGPLIPHDLTPWTVVLSNTWDVLGPFPIHAREQHYLSPSYPLTLPSPIDFTKSYLSSLADNGEVFWSTIVANDTGELKVSFPDIRWDNIRSTEGWAGLQHHSVLRTSVTIYPPDHSQVAAVSAHSSPRLLVNLVQGSFFTILARDDTVESPAPKWYSGNVYAMERAPPRSIQLPTPPSSTSPTIYDIFVSGDYEIRLFGDPQVYNSNNTPTLSLNFSINIEDYPSDLVLAPSSDVIPDFVDGWSFGSAIGVSVRSTCAKWWTITDVILSKENQDGIRLELVAPISIAPTQTRIIPLNLTQTRPFYGKNLTFELLARYDSQGFDSYTSTSSVKVTLNVTHLPHWSIPSSSVSSAIKATYFYSTSIPTAFLAKPPLEANGSEEVSRPPIIALHGAGVDIFSKTFWGDALPPQRSSWTIMPSGRTSWGSDWHGPSTNDVWSCLHGLIDILDTKSPAIPYRSPWKISRNTRVLLIGHSNGGQGAWHISERYPDKIVAVVPAAAYIKSQAYVPLSQSRSAHFVDPALRSILESSFTPDDNDLFLSNLVDIPILAVHGGNDENVPTWHSREAVSVLKGWNPHAAVTMKEDVGQPHWYNTVFSSHVVQDFIQTHTPSLSAKSGSQADFKSFTLTVAVPAESGTLHGFQIERLFIPGRLARLHVTRDSSGLVSILTTNVLQFTLRIGDLSLDTVCTVRLDGTEYSLAEKERRIATENLIRFRRDLERAWEAIILSDTSSDIQPSGRISLVLNSAAPITIIIPADSTNGHPLLNTELSYALRISHDLLVYHQLDTQIIEDREAMCRFEHRTLGPGNLVIIDGPNKTSFGRLLLDRNMTDIRLISLNGPSTGMAFLHPHPERSDANVLFLSAQDEYGMEGVLRLFPIRTGVAVPDWVIVDHNALLVGAAGVKGAGVWGDRWKRNEAASWSD